MDSLDSPCYDHPRPTQLGALQPFLFLADCAPHRGIVALAEGSVPTFLGQVQLRHSRCVVRWYRCLRRRHLLRPRDPQRPARLVGQQRLIRRMRRRRMQVFGDSGGGLLWSGSGLWLVHVEGRRCPCRRERCRFSRMLFLSSFPIIVKPSCLSMLLKNNPIESDLY